MSPGARRRANRDARMHRRPLRWLGGDTETPTVRWPLRLTGGWTGLHPGQTQVKNTQTIYLNDRTDWWFCVPLYSFRKRRATTPLTARRPASRFGWIWGQMNINRSVWKQRRGENDFLLRRWNNRENLNKHNFHYKRKIKASTLESSPKSIDYNSTPASLSLSFFPQFACKHFAYLKDFT